MAKLRGPFSGNVGIAPMYQPNDVAHARDANPTLEPEGGTSATSAMTHIAIQEQDDRKLLDCFPKTCDNQYCAHVSNNLGDSK